MAVGREERIKEIHSLKFRIWHLKNKEPQMLVVVENSSILLEIKKLGGTYDEPNFGHAEL